ncbi:MAG: molybdopterin molybdotransferase MoeA [Candidatus Undinarchaeales archaeon]|jgi:molybdopterin molybdotransferase|nr:molybdopterin molybdotransferase MoeA [Candidatus Undinarchaeales archaeon]MDP7491536.1 molybdopterin molybdotransferase MoeA [Candidatus Undinarchaeales archaeon]
MISVEDALAEILAHVKALEPVEVPIIEALGQVVAADVVANTDIPPFDNSAMDGYAVRASDTLSVPVTLRVAGSVAAGYVHAETVAPGTAVRIMTGAPLPPGADAVVKYEDTSDFDRSKQDRLASPADVIEIRASVPPKKNVRPSGEDVHSGEVVLERGRLVRPAEVGVLASLGCATVTVHRRPRVAILATGDELVDVDEPLGPGKIRNSNEHSMVALVTRTGGVPLALGIARDTTDDLTAKLRAALDNGADLVLTSGGVSVGDYDVVKDVLDAEGRMRFWQVNMKPGKPLAFGLLAGDVPLVGLPGNPVSTMVSFEQFVRPAILRMLGRSDLAKPTVRAVLDEAVSNSGRRGFIRVMVERRDDRFHAHTTGEQGSGMLTSMSRANGLAVVPEGTKRIEAGTELTVQMLDWPEGTGL